MFGIGFGEIILVLLIAIIFVRPEDLPKFLRSAGKLYGQLRKMYREVIEVKDKVIKEIDEAATMDEAPKTTPAAPSTETPKILSEGAESEPAAKETSEHKESPPGQDIM